MDRPSVKPVVNFENGELSFRLADKETLLYSRCRARRVYFDGSVSIKAESDLGHSLEQRPESRQKKAQRKLPVRCEW